MTDTRKEQVVAGAPTPNLDLQLKQLCIKIIVAGMVANTCIEATARCGAELGYQVTLVRDATAAFSFEAMHAAHEINGPTSAHAILTTEAMIDALVKAYPSVCSNNRRRTRLHLSQPPM